MTTEQAYSLLAVEPGASPKDVQRAYRKQALRFHPDRAGTPDEASYFTRRFMEVRDAYEYLRSQGFPVPETQVVLEDVMPGEWARGRSFAPKDDQEARRFKRETDYEVKIGPGTIILWGVIIPGSAVTIVYVLKTLFERLAQSP